MGAAKATLRRVHPQRAPLQRLHASILVEARTFRSIKRAPFKSRPRNTKNSLPYDKALPMRLSPHVGHGDVVMDEGRTKANVEMTAGIVSAYVSNNRTEPGELSKLIQTVYSSLAGAGHPLAPADEPVTKLTPAQVKRSITPSALISFIDGKAYKTLKRHLAKHGLTAADYKSRYGLPQDYP